MSSHHQHHRHSKGSSGFRRSDEERTRPNLSSYASSRTVIYEEASNKTLKSAVQQVPSFYDTSKAEKSNSQPLTVGSGKQSRAINSDLYNLEIVEDEDEKEEGEMDYYVDDYQNQTHKRHKDSHDEQTKRRRRSSSHSSVSDSDSDDKSRKRKEKGHRNRKRRHSSKEKRSPSEEGEEAESISDGSDESPSKAEDKNQTEKSNHSSNDEHSHSEHEDAVEQPVPPHRSRFDDHDDDQDDEENQDELDKDSDDDAHQRHSHRQPNHHRRHRHHHHHHHHKKSRHQSSSPQTSSSSKSPVQSPVEENRHVEKEVVEEKPKLPNYYPAIQGCRRVDEYLCLNRIEEGAYGIVFRAKDKRTGELVALKRLKMEKEKEGFPITSLREICCILKSQHENVCTVREIVVGDDMNRIYIVMDYVEHDLKSLMTHTMKKPFSIGEVKTLLRQLLAGVAHLHDNWIIHRDLKTSNLLFSNSGILKIGDFGLAREYGSPLKPYTPIVVTLWYRSPELLLGIKEYSTPIDMWSVGAIFGEFLLMKPLFPGKSELDQLNRIFKDLGTPNEKIWPEYNSLPFTKKMTFANVPYNRLRNRFDATLSEKGFDLLNKFLTYDPSKRISAADALKHPYFDESPRPIDPSMFPTWPSRNEERDKTNRAGVSRAPGSSATAAQDEPKAPSAGKMYEKLLGGGDDDSDSMEQILPPASSFQLRG